LILVLGTELSEKNKIQAILSLAVTVLRYSYSFGIINWRPEELQKLDRKTRKLLTYMDSIMQRQTWVSCMFLDNREEGV